MIPEQSRELIICYVTGQKERFSDETLLAAIESRDADAILERLRQLDRELTESPDIDINDPRYDELLTAFIMMVDINPLLVEDEPPTKDEYDDGNGGFCGGFCAA